MTHTYPEIKPADIKAGDTIRCEYASTSTAGLDAVEYVASISGGQSIVKATYFLIDRPTPPVELPTKPTLGRLSWDCDGQRGSEVAAWMVHGDGVYGGSGRVPAKGVTEFVPGVFVPTSALDELRHEHLNAACVVTQGRQNLKRSDAIHTFLADVDRANP